MFVITVAAATIISRADLMYNSRVFCRVLTKGLAYHLPFVDISFMLIEAFEKLLHVVEIFTVNGQDMEINWRGGTDRDCFLSCS